MLQLEPLLPTYTDHDSHVASLVHAGVFFGRTIGYRTVAISVDKIHLWRGEVPDRPGTLASTMGALAASAAGLKVIMGYSYPGGGEGRKAILELFPVTGTATAAQRADLTASMKPTLLISGDDRLGLSEAFYRAIAEEGINIDFLVAQALGDHYSVVIGFATEAEADRAAALVQNLADRSESDDAAN